MLGKEVCPGRSFAGRVAVVLGGEASSANTISAWKHKQDKAIAAGPANLRTSNNRAEASLRRRSPPQHPRDAFVPCGPANLEAYEWGAGVRSRRIRFSRASVLSPPATTTEHDTD